MGKRYVIIGDVHGNTNWQEVIENEPDADMIVFLGDFVDSHKLITEEQQLTELDKILSLKESMPERIIILRGNHDEGYMYHDDSYARYSRSLQDKFPIERFKNNSQWIYQIPDTNILCSHAGISEVWFKEHGFESIEEINTCDDKYKFTFIPCRLSDYYGTSETQPCTWIRPQTLCNYAIKGYTQVVGHTPVRNSITTFLTVNEDRVWLCDALDLKQYLVIEDENFEIKTL